MSLYSDVDTDLIVAQLRRNGHTVDRVISVPENAGNFEFIVDGETYHLEMVEALIAEDQAKERVR